MPLTIRMVQQFMCVFVFMYIERLSSSPSMYITIFNMHMKVLFYHGTMMESHVHILAAAVAPDNCLFGSPDNRAYCNSWLYGTFNAMVILNISCVAAMAMRPTPKSSLS